MDWLRNVTLQDAYKIVKQKKCFALWVANGNYMDLDIHFDGNNVETRVFLGESIFLLGLSIEVEDFNIMASEAYLIDIWSIIKEKYPKLFQEGITGKLWLIP